MSLNGAAPTFVSQDGSATLPGALDHAVGVGVITFGAGTPAGCSVTGGAMIFNTGDIQTNPAGVYFGPAHCYDAFSALGTGLPCWDGGDANEMSGALSNPGANGNGSYDLNIFAKYAWFDASIAAGTVPFSFTLQNTLGSSIVVGATKSDAGAGVAPIVTLTMQKIGHPNAVPTVVGAAPYVGLSSVSCLAWGANTTDFVAAGNQSTGIAGGAQSVTGSVQTFTNGQAGGSISFNGNDDIVTSGSSPSNNDCAISVSPGTAFGGSFAFPDGTSNTVASIGSSVGPCHDDLVAGAGYANSAVQWGATDGSAYLTTTGLFSTATGFVPPGGESTCTTYTNSPAGSITNLMVPTAFIAPDSGSSTGGYIKFTNTTPADCSVTATLSGTTSDGICHLTVNGSPTSATGDSLPDSPSTLVFTTACTCTAEDPMTSGAINATMTITSSNCQLSGTTVHTPVTCSN